jgi:hypothetical protein
MSVQVQNIYNRVRTQLIDTGATQRWSNQELINWICDGQRELVAVLPRASQVRAVVQMVAGTRQTIPAAGWMFLTAYRNMGSTGTTPGQVLLKQPRMLMDTQYPNWHSAAQVAQPNTFVFDPSDPTAFYVYQPSDGTGQVEISYSVMPTDLANPTDLIQVQDIYQSCLFDYCMYRATMKDSDFAAGQAVSAAYFSAFTAAIQNFLKDPLFAATNAEAT